ncbi:UBX domain-containing protein 1 [Cylas formicarius]|uniref:UBX domain-containing protein 1 n=1 Tax=Cylas formicarius TaxID=197179 RepID=UPI0029588791|nr:UBX domain-containing protein 1 [Cylas formicarius]XP_060529971.1 UBX domain-containing protein 1 [Cylas formicarius]
MPDVILTVMEMGFSRERAELAVAKTGSQDMQAIMEWLLSHEEDTDAGHEGGFQEPNPLSLVEQPEQNSSESTQNQAPKSIRCDDCGKLFKSNQEVEFHASKSGHENFSESTEEKKPLTEEEKKEQLAKIEAKLKQRRLEREQREKEEALLREKARIRSGKELLEAKKKQDELEMKKIIEQRKRAKEEERLARQRVKEQIEQDKLARKAKFSGSPMPEPSQTQPISVRPVENKPPSNCTEVRLQIRLTDGKTLTQNFGLKEPLSAVKLFIEINRTDEKAPFKLITSYPKRVFSEEDYDKPLESLGLAPSATLNVLKS